MKIAIITGCSKEKMPSKMAAIDFYKGQFFLSVKRLVEKMGTDIFIISGKYGLILPSQIIEPYDQRIKTHADILRLEKTLEPLISKILQQYDLVFLFMGSDYQAVLEHYWNSPKVIRSEDHRGSGGYKQLSKMLFELSPNNFEKFLKTILQTHQYVSVENLENWEKK